MAHGAAPAKVSRNAVSVQLPQVASGALEIDVGNSALRFEPEGARTVAVEDTGGRAVFHRTFPATDLIYEKQRGGVEWFYWLANESAPTEFDWRVDLPAALPTVTRERSGALDFADSAGRVRLRIPVPVLVDARGVTRAGRLSWAHGRLRVSIDVAGLTYPILLDPCVSDTDCPAHSHCSDAQICESDKALGQACDSRAGYDCNQGGCAVCGECASCVGNVCQVSPRGDPGSPSCAPFRCDGASNFCPQNCEGRDSNCYASDYCTAAFACQARKPQGSACDDSAGADCGQAGCRVCAGGPCAGCTGGVCGVAQAGYSGSPSCAPYACNGSSLECPTSCTSDADCASGHHCASDHTCVAIESGAGGAANDAGIDAGKLAVRNPGGCACRTTPLAPDSPIEWLAFCISGLAITRRRRRRAVDAD